MVQQLPLKQGKMERQGQLLLVSVQMLRSLQERQVKQSCLW